MKISRFFYLLFILQFLTQTLSAQVLWEHVLETAITVQEIGRHAQDADGNIIVVGSFEGTVKIGDFVLTGTELYDGFVYKTTPAGQVVWAKAFTGQRWCASRAASTDKDGNIYVMGSFYKNLYLDGKLILNVAYDSPQSFFCKLDKNGNLLWVNGIIAESQNASAMIQNHIASNKNGDVVFAIRPYGKIKLADNVVTENKGTDHTLIIACYAANGSLKWYANPPTTDLAEAYDVVIDEAGEVLLTGLFLGSITFESTQLATVLPNHRDIFIARYNSSGKAVWAKAFYKTNAQQLVTNYGRALAIDPATQDVYIAGNFKGRISVDGTVLEARNNQNGVGFYDQFVARLNANGELLWAKKLTIAKDGYVNDIFWEDGELVVGGKAGDFPYIKTVNKDGNEGFEYVMTLTNGGNGEVKTVSSSGKRTFYLSGHHTTGSGTNWRMYTFLRKVETTCTASSLPAQPILSYTCTQLKIDNAPGAAGITWYKEDMAIPSQTTAVWASPPPGVYKVSFQNSCGVSFSEPLLYNNNPPQKPVLSYTCSQLNIENVSASEKISWYRNDVLLAGNKASVLPLPLDGRYKVAVENACGVTFSDQLNFSSSEFLPPTPIVTSDCRKLVVQNQGTNTITWYLNGQLLPNEHGAELLLHAKGAYQVQFDNGCGTAAATIPIAAYVPAQGYLSFNVITPNGDYKNDYFILDPALEGSLLQIFNRWGQRVYENTNYQNNWNGEGLTAGVYYWLVKNTCGGEVRGTVTLFR